MLSNTQSGLPLSNLRNVVSTYNELAMCRALFEFLSIPGNSRDEFVPKCVPSIPEQSIGCSMLDNHKVLYIAHLCNAMKLSI